MYYFVSVVNDRRLTKMANLYLIVNLNQSCKYSPTPAFAWPDGRAQWRPMRAATAECLKCVSVRMASAVCWASTESWPPFPYGCCQWTMSNLIRVQSENVCEPITSAFLNLDCCMMISTANMKFAISFDFNQLYVIIT